MPLPPRWVRRVVLAPAVVLGTVALLVLMPAWLVVATVLSTLVPGRFRLPRLLLMVTIYLVWDSVALICAFGLWVASGLGRFIDTPSFQRAHYVFIGWMLRLLFRLVRWILRLRIVVLESDLDAITPDRPLVVASRHAGPGDSFILVHQLLNSFHREPRIVLKDTLQWDPAIDVMLNRLPNRFIAPSPFADDGRPRPTGLAREVGALAAGLDENDAFVIFPEGGNFTAERRQRRIERLRGSGQETFAERAERLRHVLAPRPGGMFAALDAAPEADVVFVAHTGLDRMLTVLDIWRELPMDKQIIMHGWHVPRSQVPVGREEREDWLYSWFAAIDDWIEANQPREASA